MILAGCLQFLHVSQIALCVFAQSLLALVGAQEGDSFLDAHDAVFQSGDIILGGSLVCGAVIEGIQPLLGCFLQLRTSMGDFQQRAGGVFQSLADGLLAIIQTQTMFCAVFEQGVGPSGTLAFLVDGVGRGCSGAAPDGGATGGVGDDHVVAEQLSDHTAIGGFSAACAGAGELEQGFTELAALDGLVDQLILDGDLVYAVIEDGLLIQLGVQIFHGDGLGGADVGAGAAAHAVQGRDGDGELVLVLAGTDLEIGHLGVFRSGSLFCFVQSVHTQGSMGTDEGALVALDTLFGVPAGNAGGNAALFEGGDTIGEGTVGHVFKGGDRQAVAVHLVDGLEQGFCDLDGSGTTGQFGFCCVGSGVCPAFGHVDLDKSGSAHVDGIPVLIDHVLALLQVGVLSSVLHILDGIFGRQHLSQCEESGLEDGVGTLAHADLLGQVDGVDGVQVDLMIVDILLGVCGQVMFQFLRSPLAVDQEGTAVTDVVDDLEALGDISRSVASHEVCLMDIVGAADGAVAEAQVADGDAAGLLGVILEVCLDVLVGVVADDLDGVLVGANGTVAAQTPELGLDGARSRSAGSGLFFQGQIGQVVGDADGEVFLGLILSQLFEHSKCGSRRSILGAQAITTAADGDVSTASLCQSGDNVQIQGFTQSAGFLGTIQNGDLLDGLGDDGQQTICCEGTIQTDQDQADLFAVCVQVVHDFACHVSDGAHGDDDAVCIGSAVVVEQLVAGAQLLVDLVHILFNDRRHCIIILVASFTMLEEGVVVLVTALGGAMVGVQGAGTESGHSVHVNHVSQVSIIPNGQLLDLVRGTETVEEVQEGNAAFDGSQMSHRSQIHDFLGVGLSQHRKAGLTAGHDVFMVAEDVQSVGGQGTSSDVEDAGEQLACNFIHIGDHQQQALRCGVGGGQGAGGQGTVDGTGSASLGLHFDDLDRIAKDVLLTLSRPLIHVVGHGAGRSDRIDASHFGKCVGDPRSGVIGVHRLLLSNYHYSNLLSIIPHKSISSG